VWTDGLPKFQFPVAQMVNRRLTGTGEVRRTLHVRRFAVKLVVTPIFARPNVTGFLSIGVLPLVYVAAMTVSGVQIMISAPVIWEDWFVETKPKAYHCGTKERVASAATVKLTPVASTVQLNL